MKSITVHSAASSCLGHLPLSCSNNNSGNDDARGMCLSALLFIIVLVFPSLNTSNVSSQFFCDAFCQQSLTTWLINGSFLSHFSSSQLTAITSSNHDVQCSSNQDSYTSVLEVHADLLDPFTVQCAAVYVCGQADDVASCTPKVCYSQAIHVEGISKLQILM